MYFFCQFQGRIVNNDTVPAGGSALDGQRFLIHEEGGKERWFNLTMVNVGEEQVRHRMEHGWESESCCVAIVFCLFRRLTTLALPSTPGGSWRKTYRSLSTSRNRYK